MRHCFFTLFIFFCHVNSAFCILPSDFPKREARAVWVTTLSGLDWPKTKATDAAGRARQQEELRQLLDQLQAIHINTVLLQTRVRGSVIYPSDIEPWDVCLTGKFGRSPGYDPLQFAIDECHRRGMELHAWVVTVPCYKVAVAKQMGSNIVTKTHPALCKRHGDTYYLDPGEPASADYLAAICKEIVSRYDVDGLHFDYIRYPEKAASFPDADTYKKYGGAQAKVSGSKGTGNKIPAAKAQWRRDNITRIVRTVYQQVRAIKPWVKLSSSPVGKFRDGTRYSSKGWNCYDAVYQDAQGWLREGIQDALYPMMYFKGDHFFPFAADWSEHDAGRTIAPGLGIYFLSPKEKDWPLSVITNQLFYIRALGLSGQAYFRSQFLTDNHKGIYDYLRHEYYVYPALPLACTWIDSIAPAKPDGFAVESVEGGMEHLRWQPAQDNLAGGVRYNVYASKQWPVDISKAENLVASLLPEPTYSYNRLLVHLYGIHLAVTAIDRCGNESEPAQLEFPDMRPASKSLKFPDPSIFRRFILAPTPLQSR